MPTSFLGKNLPVKRNRFGENTTDDTAVFDLVFDPIEGHPAGKPLEKKTQNIVGDELGLGEAGDVAGRCCGLPNRNKHGSRNNIAYSPNNHGPSVGQGILDALAEVDPIFLH